MEHLLEDLECPICKSFMEPPIFLCQRGHSTCGNCIRKIQNCSLCRAYITPSRNVTLEALAVKMPYPCNNKPWGCQQMVSVKNRKDHELNCPHKGYRCMECSWLGRLDDVESHLANNHKNLLFISSLGNFVFSTKIEGNSSVQRVLKAFNKLFWFKTILNNSALSWRVKLIGTTEDAEKFYCEIKFSKFGRKYNKVVLSNYCQSVDNHDRTLQVSGELAKIYEDRNSELVYSLRISPV